MLGAEGHTRCRRPVECLEPPVTALPLAGWAPPEGSAPAPQASTVPPVALALPSEGSALPPEDSTLLPIGSALLPEPSASPPEREAPFSPGVAVLLHWQPVRPEAHPVAATTMGRPGPAPFAARSGGGW